ncbi:MAG: thiamine pyrophosphate-dependent enzyme [Actinomycetota bacterium]|nr:thiamine pyrophosphate-dependent enzyme [Actinomycetota bacterium]
MGHDPDIWSLYTLMKTSRLFEEAVARLWNDGLISGEMHLGTGEEAIVAGVVSQLRDGDAMALDHRGTAALLMRGIDPIALIREMLGRSDGLCAGQGGHMHLFSQPHLAASSGIVGAAGPAAAGFALAAQHLRPGSVAVAFFGEGSMNQGMLMASLNLAAAWELPVLFVCKDDDWAITTKPDASTRGAMRERVSGLGVHYEQADGLDVEDVWRAAHRAVERARSGRGPSFLHANCVHLEGHFLGLMLLRVVRDPVREMVPVGWGVTRSLFSAGGASASERVAGVRDVMLAILTTLRDPRRRAANDPIERVRAVLATEPERLSELDARIEADVAATLASALDGVVA